MKNRKFLRALMAALLCLALLCPAFATAEEALVLEGDALVPNDSGELAPDLELNEALDDPVAQLPQLDLDGALTLDGIDAGASESIELGVEPRSNDDAGTDGEAEPVADPVPLIASYSGGTLSKVYDCNRYGAYTKVNDDGTQEIVYIIEALRTIKSQFALTPAKGKEWVEGHEDVQFRLILAKQFDAADVGKYNFEFKLELSGDNAGYYKIKNPVVKVAAKITQRPVIITPRAGLSKVYGAKDPFYPEGSWLSKEEMRDGQPNPLYQDISGVPGYGVPINTEDGKTKITVDDGLNGAYLLKEAQLKGTKFFPNDGWLTRKAGEKPGKYRILRGNMDFGSNFKIKVAKEYFTITPRDINNPTVTVSAIRDKTYTGKAIKPNPVLRFNGKKLKKNTHYTLKYAHNKALGNASITITGKGNFTGTRKLTFKIVLKPTAISRLKAGVGKITVVWKKGSKNSGYQIDYSMDADFYDDSTLTVKGIKKTSATLKNLQSKKIYYVRIRTYKTVKGVTYYSAWSKTKKIRTK